MVFSLRKSLIIKLLLGQYQIAWAFSASCCCPAGYRHNIVTQASKKSLTSSEIFVKNSQAEEKMEKQSQLQTPILMKKQYSLLTGLIASTVVLCGANALAQDIATVEAQASGTPASLTSDPVVTAILSRPGLYGGHTYTTTSFLVHDSTGSLDIFASTTLSPWLLAEGRRWNSLPARIHHSTRSRRLKH